MITRRTLLTGVGAVGLNAGLSGCGARASGPWRALKSGETITINGNRYEAECGANPAALQVSRQQTVRFSMISGNFWEKDDPSDSERTELDGWKHTFPPRVPMWSSWSMYYEPGPWSTSDWCILRQVYPWSGLVLKPGGILHWVGPAVGDPPDHWPSRHEMPIAQGRWLHFVEHLMLDPEQGNGFWRCWLDGQQVVDHRGAVGQRNAKYYFGKFGIYRGRQRRDGKPADETISIRYANMRFGRKDLSHIITKPDPDPTWEEWR